LPSKKKGLEIIEIARILVSTSKEETNALASSKFPNAAKA